MAGVEFVEHVKGLGDLYVIEDSFDNQVSALKEAGIEAPESVRDASYVRLHGKSQDSTRTCHASICAKNSDVIIARVSPVIENVEMLTAMVNAHRNNQYPVFAKEIFGDWEKVTEQDKRLRPEKRRAIVLPHRTDYRIHRDSDEARFFWQDTRKIYFKEKVIGDSVPAWQIPTSVVDSTDGTIVNYVGFVGSEIESDLNFRDKNLDYSYAAFGLLRETGKPVHKNL